MREKVKPRKVANIKSMYKNSKSVIPPLIVYKIMTDVNCVKLYIQINLTTPNEVTNADRPSRIINGTHSILGFLDVNGLATEASAFESDIPELANK